MRRSRVFPRSGPQSDSTSLGPRIPDVLKALRGGGIDIVGIHSHMTHENTRILFLHYWGKGSTSALSKMLKSALATQAR